jgi:hypothetical protein
VVGDLVEMSQRRHDDVHFPMGGKGRRARKRYAAMLPRATLVMAPDCPNCMIPAEFDEDGYFCTCGWVDLQKSTSE